MTSRVPYADKLITCLFCLTVAALQHRAVLDAQESHGVPFSARVCRNPGNVPGHGGGLRSWCSSGGTTPRGIPQAMYRMVGLCHCHCRRRTTVLRPFSMINPGFGVRMGEFCLSGAPIIHPSARTAALSDMSLAQVASLVSALSRDWIFRFSHWRRGSLENGSRSTCFLRVLKRSV